MLMDNSSQNILGTQYPVEKDDDGLEILGHERGIEPEKIPVPNKDPMELSRNLDGKMIRLVKNDGCSTNMLSREFVGEYGDIFKIITRSMVISHYGESSNVKATEMVTGAVLKLGNHEYTSNWVVRNCRYDVMLNMPWYVENDEKINYKQVVIKTPKVKVFLDQRISNPRSFKVKNLGVKIFRKLIKRNYDCPTLQVL